MPLIGDPEFKPLFDSKLRGVAFQMKANDSLRNVRVVVTYHALSDINEAEIMNFPVALECLKSFRDRIEAAASMKFDRIGLGVSEWEGFPTVLLMTGDPL